MTSNAARLTVTRTSPKDIGQREVFVSLDGQEMAIMKFGETATREVAPGTHLLSIHNTLFRKKFELTLAPGQHVRFSVVNRSGWGTYAIASVLGAGPIYMDIERDEPA